MRIIIQTLIFGWFFLATTVTSAQNLQYKRSWHWYFGHGAGIDFSNGNPMSDTLGRMEMNEGCSAISDTAGNLLFYTNGVTVWNSVHDTMDNGKNLMGCLSTTLSAMILPVPESDSLFYLFTNDCFENSCNNGLRYSIVDISLNGGLGKVIETNHLLFSPSTEKFTVVLDGNTNGYWLIAHALNSNNYLAFHITSAGVNTSPVISSTGSFLDFSSCYAGYLKSSKSGSKLASCCGTLVELFDFNRSNGSILLDTSWLESGAVYSLAFSPDQSKLYVGYFGPMVIQYDLSNSNFISSPSIVFNDASIAVSLGGMQLGPDGKLYLSYLDGLLNSGIMATINFPNILGGGCDFVTSGISLNGRQSFLSICNFPEFFFSGQNDQIHAIEERAVIKTFPNPCSTELHIDVSALELGRKDFLIHNGITSWSLPSQCKDTLITIDISNLIPGLYVLRLSTVNKITYLKFIKN